MHEALLQFIWKYSLYRPDSLKTTDGEPVSVIHPGTHNTNAGPDFSSARIRIGNTLFAGNVELHTYTSDWHKHGHEADEAYQHLVLHVVFINDEASVPAGTPLLELGPHIPAYVLQQYTSLLQASAALPCATQLQKVNPLTKENWLDRLLAERLQERLGEWQEQLQQANGDWRTLLYWRTAASFGFKVNATPFLLLAQSIPLNVLGRHHENQLQLEALLFGQAGMLRDDFTEAYPQSLYNEYQFLKQKYSLTPLPASLWKFLRMRPANFPTVRLAQFAALVHQSMQLFSTVAENFDVPTLMKLLTATASPYWDTHYLFEEAHEKAGAKTIGNASAQSVIINTIAPIQFLYARQHGMKQHQEQALQLFEQLPAEKNNIIVVYEQQQWKPPHAGHSQAMLQLFNQYCSRKRCLECAIGLGIIKSKPMEGDSAHHIGVQA